uniref:Uncharacterized protein n=1 Tax=Chenopodium quinoa TaxID=63459 RepID=A0A803KP87_CHEQI
MMQEEPNKDDEEGPSSSTSNPNPNPNPCPICLGLITQDSYLDRCFLPRCLCSAFFSKDHKYRLQCYYTEPESGLLSDAFKVERYWKSHKYLQPNSWLEKWLKRELQALTQLSPQRKNTFPASKQEELRILVADAAMPFLTARTKRFVNELELFLASGLTVQAYDRAYRKCLGWKKPEETTEDDEQTSMEREQIAPYLYFFDDNQ